MRIITVVTDYIKASLLTTKGDMVKHDGASAKRMPIGTAGQIIRVNAVPDDLEYQVPGTFMFENEYTERNTTEITILSVITEIVTIDLGNVISGDRLLVHSMANIIKGAASGNNIYEISKSSGTATIQVGYVGNAVRCSQIVGSGNTWKPFISGIVKITGSGTLVLRSAGRSDTANSTVAANAGDIYVTFLKKQ